MKKNRFLVRLYRFCLSIKGMFIFYRIKRSYGNGYYFLKFGHLGDVVRTLPVISLLKDYLDSQRVTMGRVFVIIPNNQAGLVKLNPEIDEIVVLDKKKIKCLSRFAESKKNNHHLYSDSYGPFHISEVYGIPYDYVVNNLEYFRVSDKTNQEFIDDARLFVSDNSIFPEKTIILAPYAGSSSSLPNDCLDEVIKFFKDLGFRVFTNAGLSEAALPGTESLTEPANIVFGILSMGATVIGVQSGFMDSCEWLNLTNKRMKIFLVNTENDKKYLKYQKYSIERHIERRGSGVTIVSDNNQIYAISEKIKELECYNLKGYVQKRHLSIPVNELFNSLYNIFDFNEYVKALSDMRHFVLIIASSGGNEINKYFISKSILRIGSIDDNCNSLVVYDTDNGLVESLYSDDLAHGLSYQGTIIDDHILDSSLFNNTVLPIDNWLYVFSNAKDKLGYSKSSIVINGEEYSPNKEGLNVVLYSKEYCMVIDKFNVNFSSNSNANIYRAMRL